MSLFIGNATVLDKQKKAADRSPSTVKYGQDPLGQLPESSAQTRHFGLCENLRGDKAVEDGSRRVLPERPARNSHVLRADIAPGWHGLLGGNTPINFRINYFRANACRQHVSADDPPLEQQYHLGDVVARFIVLDRQVRTADVVRARLDMRGISVPVTDDADQLCPLIGASARNDYIDGMWPECAYFPVLLSPR